MRRREPDECGPALCTSGCCLRAPRKPCRSRR